jgi:hypothetical protein
MSLYLSPKGIDLSRFLFRRTFPGMDAKTLAFFKECGKRGGDTRAASLSPRRRKEIAIKASRAAAKARRKRNGA